jgi:L-seryl-tRNA(Ser) seleniumtransferase
MIDGFSTTGGGSAPGLALPTTLIAIEVGDLSAAALETRLRGSDPPIVTRIQNGRVVLDLRTVIEDQDVQLAASIRQTAASPNPDDPLH